MQFNQGTDYAFRVIMHLASLPEGTIVSSQTIADKQHIPVGFLQKIMRSLTKGGLIKSYRGTEGGFALAKPVAQISLLDVIILIEGPIDLQRCLKNEEACNRHCTSQCPVHTALVDIQADFIQALGKVKFSSMINNQER